jgi:hypothetical protein
MASGKLCRQKMVLQVQVQARANIFYRKAWSTSIFPQLILVVRGIRAPFLPMVEEVPEAVGTGPGVQDLRPSGTAEERPRTA